MLALENGQHTFQNSDSTLRDTKPQIWGLVCKCIVTEKKTELDKLITGTYIHPDLVPSVAGWISPIFQIKSNRVVNAYLVAQYKSHQVLLEQNLATVL